MKLLLINPPQRSMTDGNLPKYVDSARGAIPPLGLLYTAAAVEKRTDWEVALVDMAAGQTLENEAPDLVGITATTFTILDAVEVAKQVKQRWNVPVVVGGIHATIYPEETANLPYIDCAYAGESEETFPQSLDAIVSGATQLIQGMPVESWPMPSYHLLDLDRYYSTLGHSRRLVSMFSSRGCPFQCLFCQRLGKKFRAQSAESVVDELGVLGDMGVREVLFYDDTFTVDRTRAKTIAREIITLKDRGIIPPDLTFDIRARVDTVDSDLLWYLKTAGCSRIHYGVEASSNRIMRELRKGITIEQVEQTFHMTRQIGIEMLAYFILGSPSETREDIAQTMKWAKALKPDYAMFSIMTPYPATPLYEIGLEQGLYPDYWQGFAENPGAFELPYWPELPRDELLELRDKAYKSFYLRPRVIVKEAMRTRSLRQLANKAKGALAMAR